MLWRNIAALTGTGEVGNVRLLASREAMLYCKNGSFRSTRLRHERGGQPEGAGVPVFTMIVFPPARHERNRGRRSHRARRVDFAG
jgi:hypothetical protein